MTETSAAGPRRQEIELLQCYLGGKPFVLIELDGESTGPGEDDYRITMDVRFGGGVGGANGAMGVLAEFLEQQGWTCTEPEGFDVDAD